MIKFNVEIKEEKFYYSYEVAESNASGSKKLTPDSLVAFVKCLEILQASFNFDNNQFKDELTAKAWISKNREEASKLIQTQQ